MFSVGDIAIQTRSIDSHENPAITITKIEGDKIWHKHTGKDYSDGELEFRNYGNSCSMEDIIPVENKESKPQNKIFKIGDIVTCQQGAPDNFPGEGQIVFNDGERYHIRRFDDYSGGGIYSSLEIAKELDTSVEEIRKGVRKIRSKFLNGNEEFDRYVYTTKGGYTLDHKPEHVMYEARLRMAMGTGVLINGVYVFKTGKKIATRNFHQLKIEYKPKLLEIGRI